MNDREKWQQIIHQWAEEGLNATQIVGYDNGKPIVKYKFITALTPSSIDYKFIYDRSKKDLILDYPIYSPKENDSLGKIRKYDFSEVKKNRNVLVSYGDFWKENKCLFLENPEAKKMLVLSASEPQYHNMFSYERELAGYYDSYLSAYMVDTSRTKEELRDTIFHIILDNDEQKALSSIRLFNKYYEISEGDDVLGNKWFEYKFGENEEKAILNEMNRYDGNWIDANAKIHLTLFLDEYEKMKSTKDRLQELVNEYKNKCLDKSLDEIAEMLQSYDKESGSFNGIKYNSDEIEVIYSVVKEEFDTLGDILYYMDSKGIESQDYSQKQAKKALKMEYETIKNELDELPKDESYIQRDKLWNESLKRAEKEIQKELNEEFSERHLTDLELSDLKNSSYSGLVMMKAVKQAIASDNKEYIRELKNGNVDNYLKMINVIANPFSSTTTPRNSHFRLAMCNVSTDAYGNRYVPIYNTGNSLNNVFLNANKSKGKQSVKTSKSSLIIDSRDRNVEHFLPTVVHYPNSLDTHYFDYDGKYMGISYESQNGNIFIPASNVSSDLDYNNLIKRQYAAYRLSKNTCSISQFPPAYIQLLKGNKSKMSYDDLSHYFDFKPNNKINWEDKKTLTFIDKLSNFASSLDANFKMKQTDQAVKEACNIVSNFFVDSLITDASDSIKDMCKEYFSNSLLVKGKVLNENTLSIDKTIEYARNTNESNLDEASLDMYYAHRFADNIISKSYSERDKCLNLNRIFEIESKDVLSKSFNRNQYDIGKIGPILKEKLRITNLQQILIDIEKTDNSIYKNAYTKNEEWGYYKIMEMKEDVDMECHSAKVFDSSTMDVYAVKNLEYAVNMCIKTIYSSFITEPIIVEPEYRQKQKSAQKVLE